MGVLSRTYQKMSPVGSSILGITGANAAEDAAKAQAEMARLGVAENRRQFDITQKNLRPFYDAGIEQLPALQRGATADGFGADLAALLGGQGVSPLVDSRYNSLQQGANMAGLNMRPEQMAEMAAIDPEQALALENMLYNRKQAMANKGQTMGSSLGQYGIQSGSDIASLLNQAGQARAGGYMGAAEAQNKGLSNINAIGSSIAGAYAK